jgi:hypothetical protein
MALSTGERAIRFTYQAGRGAHPTIDMIGTRRTAATWVAIGCAAVGLAGVASASADVPGPPHLYLGTYVVAEGTCDENETCPAPTAYYRLRAEQINPGSVLVVLCSRARPPVHRGPCPAGHDTLRLWHVAVRPLPAGPGGVLRWWRSSVPRCPGPSNAFFLVRDPVTRRWSNTAHVTTSCTVA